MQFISEAVCRKRLTPSPLPLIPFTEWVERLEMHAVDTNGESVQYMVSRIHISLGLHLWLIHISLFPYFVPQTLMGNSHQPAIKLVGFMHTLAQGDSAIRLQMGTLKASVDFEVAGPAGFATDVAQRVSETMRDLEPLSAADATRWVDYWESVGMFAGQ